MSLVPFGKKASAVDNTARRQWDKQEFAKKAAEREQAASKDDDGESASDARRKKRLDRDPLHQGVIVERSLLKTREYQLDLASRLGKTQVVSLNTPLSQQAGFYCSVCDCILRDSQSYLDHINGKWHNRALGMSMRVERSTVDQVRQRLEVHKSKKTAEDPNDYVPDGMDRKALEAEAEEERAHEERRERKRASKRRDRGEDDEGGAMDPDMAALMGFAGFGTSKKS